LLDDFSPDLWSDWAFHQATGVVAAQLDTDIQTASEKILSTAAEIGESPHETALLILDRRLRLG